MALASLTVLLYEREQSFLYALLCLPAAENEPQSHLNDWLQVGRPSNGGDYEECRPSSGI
jgi:hypothetical protein